MPCAHRASPSSHSIQSAYLSASCENVDPRPPFSTPFHTQLGRKSTIPASPEAMLQNDAYRVRQPPLSAQQLLPRRSAAVDVSPLMASTGVLVVDTGRHSHGVGRARASVACIDCRRSKTKCNNKGPGTMCDACCKKGKSCDYSNADASATSVVAKRRESTVGDVDVSAHDSNHPIPHAHQSLLLPLRRLAHPTRKSLPNID
jgi:hypothetical protein